jgi:small conductance mechanosensitive channel
MVPIARFLSLQTPATPQVPDSIVGDSVGRALEQLGESVSETGRMIIEGRWGDAFARVLDFGLSLLESALPNLLSAIFVGIVFYGIFRFVYRLTRKLLNRSSRVGPGLEHLLLRTFSVAGIGFVLILVLSQLGFNVAALIAGLGIAGLALGFAAQDTLANFIAGVTILLDRPFSVGDYVEIDGTYGRVQELTLRSTRIQTPTNRTLVVPNINMINHSLTNYSGQGRQGFLRVDIDFGIAYKERPAEARAVVLPLVEDDARILDDPGPDVIVTGLGQSSVDMRLRVYLRNPGDEQPVRYAYTERIREALREADIEIPFPHLQLFIDEAKAFTGEEAPPIRIATSGLE